MLSPGSSCAVMLLSSNTLLSVDGNTANQYIRVVSKKIRYSGPDANTGSVVAFYRIKT
jgi:hypothetical protein